MNQELYIDDQLVDLSKDANIYLQFQSPFFGDLSTISSNGSFNIALPKTPNNLNIIQRFDLPDKQDDRTVLEYPRKYHKVDYYRNGVTIVEGGVAVMGLITEVINFSFVWGGILSLKGLEDKNLTDLPEPDSNIVPVVAWNTTSTISQWLNFNGVGYDRFTAGFLGADFGMGGGGLTPDFAFQRPFVRSSVILDQIESQSGITFERNSDNSGYAYGMGDFVIPLTETNGDSRTLWAQRLDSTQTTMTQEGRWYQDGLFFKVYSSLRPLNYTDPLGIFTASDHTFDSPEVFNFENGFTIYVYVEDNTSRPADLIHYYDDNDQSVFSIGGTFISSTVIATNSPIYNSTRTVNCYRHEYRIPAHQFSPSEDTTIRIHCNYGIRWITTGLVDRQYYPSMVTNSGAFQVVSKIGDVVFPTTVFPLMINLPEIKQIDFIKTLMHLTGVFAYQKGVNEIGFIDLGTVADSEAIDWTEKLIQMPTQTSFKLENFAQRNHFKYAEDATVETKADGYIDVINETLDTTADLVTLEFTPCDIKRSPEGYNYAFIPLYIDGEMQSVEPKILRGEQAGILTTSITPLGVANFNLMRFGDVITNFYANYQRIVANPRVQKVKCLVSDYELSTLDLNRKYYFEQLGHSFIISTLRSAPSNVCEIEMIEVD